MKYCLIILALCLLFCACAKDRGYYAYKNNGILEEEFDILVAPSRDYANEVSYEHQIRNDVKDPPRDEITSKPTAKQQKKPSYR